MVLPGFDPATVLATIEKYRITSTMLVPTMLYALLDYPDLDKYDLSSLETVFYGASAISPTRLAEAIEKFGSIFFQFYGQAECPMTISVLRKEDHDLAVPERLASCGRSRCRGCMSRCSTTRATRSRPGSPARSVCADRW